ncbi:MAG: TonB-dependent receptor plug domain-containing protein, partial [Janthinobacterium sp.]
MRRSTASAAVSSFPFHLTPVRRALRSAFAVGGLMLASSMVHAEAPTADAIAAADANGGGEGTSLQSVTVTAQKREESAQKVPSAITVLGGKELLDTGIGRSASEILNYVPNASAGTQQHGRPRWWIRGVGAGQQQIDFPNPVGFYLDDVYISNSSATGFPLFDLDRVE